MAHSKMNKIIVLAVSVKKIKYFKVVNNEYE
jgi:hypothetical protein